MKALHRGPYIWFECVEINSIFICGGEIFLKVDAVRATILRTWISEDDKLMNFFAEIIDFPRDIRVRMIILE